MNLFRYWSPSGRFTRLQWWRFQIWAMFGFIVVLFASINIANDTLRVGFVALAVAALFLTWIIVGLKRLHDRNKSAWWVLLFYFCPPVVETLASLNGLDSADVFLNILSLAITLWAFVELGFLRGTFGPNRYGPDPMDDVAYLST